MFCAQPAGPEPPDQGSGNAEIEASGGICTSDRGSDWVGVAQSSKNPTSRKLISSMQSSLEG